MIHTSPPPHSVSAEGCIAKVLQERVSSVTKNGKPFKLAQVIFKTFLSKPLSEEPAGELQRLCVEITLSDIGAPTLLHWGVTKKDSPAWIFKDLKELPAGTVTLKSSLQTPFASVDEDSKRSLQILCINFDFLSIEDLPHTLQFVLFQEPNTWIKDLGNSNFIIPLSDPVKNHFSLVGVQSMIEKELAARKMPPTFIRKWDIPFHPTNSQLQLVGYADKDGLTLLYYIECSAPLLLHWGFEDEEKGTNSWVRPDLSVISSLEGSSSSFISRPYDEKALQTVFEFFSEDGKCSLQWLALRISGYACPSKILFVLKQQNANVWIRSDSKNDFMLPIELLDEWKEKRKEMEELRKAQQLEEKSAQQMKEAKWEENLKKFKSQTENLLAEIKEEEESELLWIKNFKIEDIGFMDVLAVSSGEKKIKTMIRCCLRVECLLHWGMLNEGVRPSSTNGTWIAPPEDIWPENTVVSDAARSCQTLLKTLPGSDGFLQEIDVFIPVEAAKSNNENDAGLKPRFAGIAMVLKEVNGFRWFKVSNGGDITVKFLANVSAWKGPEPLEGLVDFILRAELEWNQMTLMHRYNAIKTWICNWEESIASDSTGRKEPQRLCDLEDIFNADRSFYSFPSSASGISKQASSLEDERFANGREFWSWIYVWSRFSYLGLLDWQRNFNTKPRELSAATENVTLKVTEVWKNHPKYRPQIRLLLGTMSRGGNQGQAIRDKILDILHKYRIPEHGAHFYEQWHQKLHNNTTPDDIAICRAVIKFLESGGDKGEYWRVLSEHNVTRERLASYERKITVEPHILHHDVGGLINDFKDYLSIIQDVHDALDLSKAFAHSYHYLPHDLHDSLRNIIDDLTRCKNPNTLNRSGSYRNISQSSDWAQSRYTQLATIRRRIVKELNKPNLPLNAYREMLFLDLALEQHQNLLIQGCSLFSLYHLVVQLSEILFNLYGHDITNEELRVICVDWNSIALKAANGEFNGKVESALLLKSLTDRVTRFVGSQIDFMQATLGSKAYFFGTQLEILKQRLDFFVDETLRGSALLSASLCLKRIEPYLQNLANLPPWQLISVVGGEVKGELIKIPKLIHIQENVYTSPVILLCDEVSGEEEIPTGVQAVLVTSAASSPDILSHISVRARNAKILLAVCFQASIADDIAKNLVNKWVNIKISKDLTNLAITHIETPNLTPSLQHSLSRSFSREKAQKLLDDVIESSPKEPFEVMNLVKGSSNVWCVNSADFCRMDVDLVGSKSKNLRILENNLPGGVVYPQAIALPFGCFQRLLLDEDGRKTLKRLEVVVAKITSKISNEEAMKIFTEAKSIIKNYPISQAEDLFAGISNSLSLLNARSSRNGVSLKGEEANLLHLFVKTGKEANFLAILSVWASIFNLRAWVSLSKAQIPYDKLRMAVLIQELFPANYAFVLHTKNPFSDEDEMLGEMVAGLGESLVGSYSGRSLIWKMKRGGEPQLVAFPSKSIALISKPCLIYRSDSNSEDLQGYAGAGLFDSVTSADSETFHLSYSRVKLVMNSSYRQSICRKIGQLAFAIEAAFGGVPQDIEGCVIGEDTIAIVQSRPQV